MINSTDTQEHPFFLKARQGKILVSDIQQEESLIGRFIIPNSNTKEDSDIRSRWAQVKSVGDDITEIKAGAWVLVENSDVATGMTLKDNNGKKITVWNVDYPSGVLAVPENLYSEECPSGSKISALSGKVIVSDIQKGERMIGKIILPNDNGKTSGIRPRWAQVFALGEDITDIKVGEWILIKHGNWTRGAELRNEQGEQFTLWGVNWPEGVMAASDTAHDTFADESVYQTEKLER